MHLALVLYGQPRDYRRGNAAIRAFLERQVGWTVDVFYHVWTIGDNQRYEHAPWRKLTDAELTHSEASIGELRELYDPVAFECEVQSPSLLDLPAYRDTLAYRNMNAMKQSSLSNVLYQAHSRSKARDLFQTYVDATNTQYDAVLMTRFDIRVMPDVLLSSLDLTKVFVSDIHRPRAILPDNCIVMPPRVFSSWFTLTKALPRIVNNHLLAESLRVVGERLELNFEELLLAVYLLRGFSLSDVQYFKGGVV
jgi:hypothetical protein